MTNPKEKKPDAWIIYDNENGIFWSIFDTKEQAYEDFGDIVNKENISIRPVKLVFLDEDNSND